MNNILLEQAQKWLTELEIKTEAAGTFLKVSRKDVANLFGGIDENEQTANLLNELRSTISKKLYFEKGDAGFYHLTSF
jgi:hypothetical protein